jgi:DNA-binding NarL/FixJ family response regulator
MNSSGTKYAKERRTRGTDQSVRTAIPSRKKIKTSPKADGDRYQEIFATARSQKANSILTPKELQLVELLSYGYENGDIADHFQTSLQAVKNMLRTINLKLGADNRTHAVSICFRNDWLPLGTAQSAFVVASSDRRGRRSSSS